MWLPHWHSSDEIFSLLQNMLSLHLLAELSSLLLPCACMLAPPAGLMLHCCCMLA